MRPCPPPPVSAPAAASVPSSCIGICQIDPRTGWCAGCWRTLDEIAGWSTADDARKRAVWAELPGRCVQAGGDPTLFLPDSAA